MPVMGKINGDVNNVLKYCGSDSSSNRKDIDKDGFESFEYTMLLNEKDNINLYKGFKDRTSDNGRIIFVLYQTNIIKEIFHRVKEFRRISREPAIEGI